MTTFEKRQQAWLKGRWAEGYAGWFLRMKGYRVVARNIRLKSGEIDILVCKGDTLVAVEVKARSSVTEGLEAITIRQRKRIADAMSEWLGKEYTRDQKRWQNYSIRYDVVVVSKGSLKPYHLEDAYGI